MSNPQLSVHRNFTMKLSFFSLVDKAFRITIDAVLLDGSPIAKKKLIPPVSIINNYYVNMAFNSYRHKFLNYYK